MIEWQRGGIRCKIRDFKRQGTSVSEGKRLINRTMLAPSIQFGNLGGGGKKATCNGKLKDPKC